MKSADSLEDFEVVAGSDCGQIYFDHDCGFFFAVLASCNNHWILKTSPDDWWSIIVRNISQDIDQNAHKENVWRFLDKKDAKEAIELQLPSSLSSSWLFDKFSEHLRKAKMSSEYFDNMEAKFSTTTYDQSLANQVMLMSSLQKYVDFKIVTKCGINGAIMNGALQDWELLLSKYTRLKKIFKPIPAGIGLKPWFESTRKMLKNLLETFEGKPDRIWWRHILDWHSENGSGGRCFWTGWMIDFLLTFEGGENPQNFRNGTNSVHLLIHDDGVENVGKLVAGTFGFFIGKSKFAPVVQAEQGPGLKSQSKSALNSAVSEISKISALISAVSEWVKKTSADQRCFRAVQRWFSLNQRCSALDQN